MSSTAPTRQALSNLINHTDSGPSQRQRRERRPSEKALYQVEEDQERREARRRPSGQEKIKPTRKHRGDRATQDSTQFSSQAIALSKGNVSANGPLDLRPRFSTVPPREKHTPRPKPFTQVHTPAPSRTSVSGGSGGGWCDDPLTKETGFFNREPPNREPPPAPRKLTTARANELIQLRRAQSNGDLNNGVQYDGTEQNGDNYEDHDNDEDNNNYEDHDDYEDHNNNEDPNTHDGDDSDVFAGGDTFYGEGDDYEDQRHLKRMRLPPSDDEGEHSRKRMRESSHSPSPQQGEQTRLPRKIHQSKGRVAARDYEVAVQQLIKYAISHFCVRLASEYAYPDRMTQVLWAKEAWKEACNHYEIEIGFNGEIIQMITRRTSHLTSEVKGK
ncbi:hypothetical protein BDR03DRAFT_988191, partial [Suillus americanus]